MSIDLWVSIALAIPLAIAANILTPKAQKWLDSRVSKGQYRKSAKQRAKRQTQLKSLEAEFKEVSEIHEDKANLTHHFLFALLQVAMYGAFGSIYASIFTFAGEVGRWDGFLGVVGRLGGQAVALFTAMLIFLTCAKAVRLARRVKSFDEYKEKTEKLLAELRRDDA
jgi:hypothetical protein